MAYDALAESVRLIEHGLPDSAASRASRRIRHIPLAVDVDGPIAATMFLRRGPGHVRRECHVLVRRDGSWELAGGGGGGAVDADDAPSRADLGGYLDVGGGGGLLHLGSPLPRIVRYATLRAAREVRTVLVAGRAKPVPRHGWLIAVWPDRRAPHLTALDAAGAVLAAGDAAAWPGLTWSPRPPEVYTDDTPG